jgi:Peptidase family S64
MFSSISETTEMNLEDRGIKFGRTTGYTTGVLNAIQSHCMLPNSDGESVEWCFVGNKCEFSRKGDSGSFVLSVLGELGGIIIGGTTSHYDYTDLTYVTPINEVFQDIEQRLGYTVHLPEVDES